MKVITVGSLKGGIGKTTCAVFLSQALASRGARVQAIDLDPCPNLTDFYLRELSVNELSERNVRHVLTGARPASEVIYHTKLSVDVIPSTVHLNTVGVELAADPGAILRFPSIIETLDYDYVIIDTPPYLAPETRSALYAAHQVIVPVDLDRWTVHGYRLLRDEMSKVEKTTGLKARLNVLAFRVSETQAATLYAMTGWNPLAKSAILKNAAVKNAINRGYALKPDSQSSEQFLVLAKQMEAKK
jgi:chromosome partitioning protein